MDKMAYGQNVIGQMDKMSLDKMVWTKMVQIKWYGNMVASFGIDYN